MKVGIDFGTTRIVVAAADRGNFPVTAFEDAGGNSNEWIPALAAVREGEVRYGWDAWACLADASWTPVRSLKRLLESAGPATRVEIGGREFPLLDLLVGLASSIRRALPADETVEAMVGVPANSNSNQRYLTAEAFRRAGFLVLGLFNEPSAAGVEYAHALSARGEAGERLLVYDLGGGTFDVSLVDLQPGSREVTGTESIPTLGGDDFDQALAEMVLGLPDLEGLPAAEAFALLDRCRVAKEALNPNSRRAVVELDEGPAAVAVADYYERCRPMVEETLNAVDDLLDKAGGGAPDCLYVTGGGSELPLVGRMLRERFGRKVKRSAYTRSATAIGLAILADGQAGFALRERFSRYFGVWREADGGRRVVFDPVFAKGLPLPGASEAPLKYERTYAPAHNIGHFRYLESTAVDADGAPAGNLTLWDEIHFPFDPALRESPGLAGAPVERSLGAPQKIVESWTCDASGAVEVAIANETAGYARRYRLGHWKGDAAAVKPTKSRRRKA